MTLKIFRSGFSSPFPESLVVYFISGDQNPINGDTTLIGNISDVDQGVWIDTSVAIPFLNDSGFIAFKYNTVGAAWTTYIIDNIEIKAATAGTDQKSEFKGNAVVYPNITSGSITLNINSLALNNSTRYDLISATGQTFIKNKSVNTYFTTIERNGLHSGLYFIILNQANGGRKLIKFSFID